MPKKLRILQCHVCKSLEQLPDYQGPPENDVLLATLAERHKFPSGEPHRGNLMDVEEAQWNSPSTRQAIIDQIHSRSGYTGFEPEFYAVRNTFMEDAATCWKQHNRDPACGDYRSDKKKIYPDTRGDRKELGLSVKDIPNRWLCDFCVVDTLVKAAQGRN